MSSRPSIKLIVISVCTLLAGSAAAEDWAQFRGPRVDGVSAERGIIGERVGLTPVWQAAIGSGYSGVAIAGGKVVTMYTDGDVDVAAAFDENTGARLWRYELGPYYKGHDGSHDGPVATPLIHDNMAFVYGPLGHFAALDLDTGKPRWTTDVQKDHGCKLPFYGFGSSPVWHDGVVVLSIGAPDGAIAGFDPATGEKTWLIGNDPGGVNYQTPVPVRHAGQDILIAAGMSKLFGIDDGKLLWEYEYKGEGGRGAMSMVPVPAGDGKLLLAYQDKKSKLVALDGSHDAVTVSTVWDDRSIRNSYNIPVYHDGHLYAYSSRFLTCVDATTGKSVWKSRAPGDGFLIGVDDLLVILTKEGSLHIAPATPDGYRERAGIEVFEDLAWSPPSFANGHVVARALDGLARVKITGAPAVARVLRGGQAPHGSQIARMLRGVTESADKTKTVKRFMEDCESFPFVEDDTLVTFVYQGEGQDLALAGDMFGARREEPMHRVPGTDLFYYSLYLDADTRMNYVFIRDYEIILDPRNPRQTVTTLIGDEMEMSFDGSELAMSWMAMPRWQKPLHLTEASAQRGRVETVSLESKVLEGQRGPFGQPPEDKFDVDVYLPFGYDDGSTRYPVAYIHGGQGAAQYGELVKAADNLIGRRMAPVILVFIKRSSMAPSYGEMVTTELIPMIDGKYRTIAERGGRASIGFGFDGGAAMTCAVGNRDHFAKLGTISAAIFGFMGGDLKNTMPPHDEAKSLEVVMMWSSYEFRNPHEAWDMGATNREYAEVFKDKGYPLRTTVVNDGAGWSSWRNHTDDLFEELFPTR